MESILRRLLERPRHDEAKHIDEDTNLRQKADTGQCSEKQPQSPKELTTLTTVMPSVSIENIIEKYLASKPDAENQVNKESSQHVVPIQMLNRTWMDYSWKCYYCKSLFPNIDELQTHSMQMHNSCKPYQCTECKVTLKNHNLDTFITHVRRHRKYLNHSCYKCFKMYSFLDETKQHTKEDHKSSDYICIGCNITFPGEGELSEHISKYFKTRRKPRINVTVEDLTCRLCNKVYPNLESIKRHKLTHENREKEYVCHICGKSYLHKGDCKNHIATHDSKKVWPQCDVCKMTFKTRYSLKVHSSMHLGVKPYICDICGKSFRARIYMVNHSRSHTDIFPFTCTICNKKFRTKTNLDNHMIQHTGVKPYACEICDKDFTNLSNRNKHMRRVHHIEMVKKKNPPKMIASNASNSDVNSEISNSNIEEINVNSKNTTQSATIITNIHGKSDIKQYSKEQPQSPKELTTLKDLGENICDPENFNDNKKEYISDQLDSNEDTLNICDSDVNSEISNSSVEENNVKSKNTTHSTTIITNLRGKSDTKQYSEEQPQSPKELITLKDLGENICDPKNFNENKKEYISNQLDLNEDTLNISDSDVNSEISNSTVEEINVKSRNTTQSTSIITNLRGKADTEQNIEEQPQSLKELTTLKDLGENICDPKNFNENKKEYISNQLDLNEDTLNISDSDVNSEISNSTVEEINVKSKNTTQSTSIITNLRGKADTEQYSEEQPQSPKELITLKDLGENICDPKNFNENKKEYISDQLNLNEVTLNISDSDMNIEISNSTVEEINGKCKNTTQSTTIITESNIERNDDDDFNINITTMMPSAPVENIIEKDLLASKPDADNQANKESSQHVVPIQTLNRTWMDYSWKCYYCKSLFPNIDELHTHSMQMHNSCKPYQCTECNGKMDNLNLDTFITHMRMHRKYLYYSCHRCFKTYPTLHETEKHTKEVHEHSNYICLGCNFIFPNKNELTKHIKKYFKTRRIPRIIATVDDLTCSLCNKTYPNLESIKRHKRTHENREREYVCHICGKAYLNKGDCTNHIATHDSKKVWPQCDVCKMTFKTRYSLKVHSSIHLGVKPYTCDICGKGFRARVYMVNHSRSHTDIFPFTCTICNKKFRTKTNLDNHMIQHTGIKPYACEICDKDFTNLSNRNKHMRRVHHIEMVKKKHPHKIIASVQMTEEFEKSEADLNVIKQDIKEPKSRGRPKRGKRKKKK